MPETFDLNLFPILRLEGQDQVEFPGLYAATPPHRPARGREQDHLVLYLSPEGSAVLPPAQQIQWLTRLAQTFYKTSGPVTSVLRKMAELLNHSLLEWNLSHSEAQGFVYLTQMVTRGDQVYLSHSGPGHAYLLTPAGVQDYCDLEDSGRGLGFSRAATLRYFQFTLQSGAFILLTHQPGEVWQVEALQIAPNQGMESMRRKLLVGRSDPALKAVLIQALAGEGKVRFLRLKTSFRDMARPHLTQPATLAKEPSPEGQPPPSAILALEEAGQPEAPPEQGDLKGETASGEQPFPSEQVVPLEPAHVPKPAEPYRSAPARKDARSAAKQGEAAPATPAGSAGVPDPRRAQERAAGHSAARSPRPAIAKQPSGFSRAVRRGFSGLLQMTGAFLAAIGSALRQVGRFLLTWLKRLLPDESMVNLSPRALLFIAIAVPLVVGVVGGMVYIERGQAAQYQKFYDQAAAQAAQALEKTDPIEQRLAWQTALEYLDEAEFYRLTPESQAMRLQAQNSLDLLDGTERLDYQPALLSKLSREVKITRLAAQGGDLYMLNGVQGNVIRAVLVGGGYQEDQEFVCGPVASGAALVGPLVDIAPLPRGEESGATLIGVDASGTLILCIPGEQPLIQPVNPPGVNFGEIRAFDLNAGDLYYLDPPQNAVWIYRRRETANPPRLFFGDEIPHMQNVIDLAINNDDLYMLHADGHQSLCAYLPDSATRCEDPLEYVDLRPGRSSGRVIPEALFSQIQFAPPPDPSLYLLEPESHAVYHFSLRLALQRQYQPLRPLEDRPATAFAISANRIIFLALGHEVFYAALP